MLLPDSKLNIPMPEGAAVPPTDTKTHADCTQEPLFMRQTGSEVMGLKRASRMVMDLKQATQIVNLIIRAAVLFLLLCLCVLALEMRGIVKEANSSVQAFSKQAEGRLLGKGQIADIVKATLLHVDRVAGETAILARQEHGAAAEANRKLTAMIGHADDSLAALTQTIQRIGGGLDTVTGDTHVVLSALAKDLDDVDPILKNTNQAIADLDAHLINDPDIKEAIKSLAQTMQHVDGIATNVEGVTGHLDNMSAEAEQKFWHMLHDKPSLKARVLLALRLAYQVALIKATLGQ